MAERRDNDKRAAVEQAAWDRLKAAYPQQADMLQQLADTGEYDGARFELTFQQGLNKLMAEVGEDKFEGVAGVSTDQVRNAFELRQKAIGEAHAPDQVDPLMERLSKAAGTLAKPALMGPAGVGMAPLQAGKAFAQATGIDQSKERMQAMGEAFQTDVAEPAEGASPLASAAEATRQQITTGVARAFVPDLAEAVPAVTEQTKQTLGTVTADEERRRNEAAGFGALRDIGARIKRGEPEALISVAEYGIPMVLEMGLAPNVAGSKAFTKALPTSKVFRFATAGAAEEAAFQLYTESQGIGLTGEKNLSKRGQRAATGVAMAFGTAGVLGAGGHAAAASARKIDLKWGESYSGMIAKMTGQGEAINQSEEVLSAIMRETDNVSLRDAFDTLNRANDTEDWVRQARESGVLHDAEGGTYVLEQTTELRPGETNRLELDAELARQRDVKVAEARLEIERANDAKFGLATKEAKMLREQLDEMIEPVREASGGVRATPERGDFDELAMERENVRIRRGQINALQQAVADDPRMRIAANSELNRAIQRHNAFTRDWNETLARRRKTGNELAQVQNRYNQLETNNQRNNMLEELAAAEEAAFTARMDLEEISIHIGPVAARIQTLEDILKPGQGAVRTRFKNRRELFKQDTPPRAITRRQIEPDDGPDAPSGTGTNEIPGAKDVPAAEGNPNAAHYWQVKYRTKHGEVIDVWEMNKNPKSRAQAIMDAEKSVGSGTEKLTNDLEASRVREMISDDLAQDVAYRRLTQELQREPTALEIAEAAAEVTPGELSIMAKENAVEAMTKVAAERTQRKLDAGVTMQIHTAAGMVDVRLPDMIGHTGMVNDIGELRAAINTALEEAGFKSQSARDIMLRDMVRLVDNSQGIVATQRAFTPNPTSAQMSAWMRDGGGPDGPMGPGGGGNGGSGDIDPLQVKTGRQGHWDRVRRWVDGRYMEKFGESGKAAAKLFDEADRVAATSIGRDLSAIEADLKALVSNSDLNTRVADILNGKTKDPSGDDWLLARRIRGVLDDISVRAQELDVQVLLPNGKEAPFRTRKDFYPHQLRPDMLSALEKGGKRTSRLRKRFLKDFIAHNKSRLELAAKEQGITVEQAASNAIDNFREKADIKRASHLEFAREYGIPDRYLDKDAARVVSRYIVTARKRLADIEMLGRKFESVPGSNVDIKVPSRMKDLVAQSALDGHDAGILADLIHRAAGGERAPIGRKKSVEQLTTIQAATKMSMSAITNLNDLARIAADTDMHTALMAAIDGLVNAQAQKRALRGGAVPIDLLDLSREVSGAGIQFGGKQLTTQKMLRYFGFTATESYIRKTTVLAGQRHAQKLLNGLQAKYKAKGGDWGKMGTGDFAYRRLVDYVGGNHRLAQDLVTGKQRMTDTMLDNIGFQGLSRQQPVSRLDLPYYWQTPDARIITQFKSWGLKHTRWMMENLVGEARKGNFGPLMRFVVLAPLFGEVTLDIKSLIRGEWLQPRSRRRRLKMPRNLEEVALRMAGNLVDVGGMGMVGDMTSAVAYGNYSGGLAGWLLGPTLGDVASMLQLGVQAGAKTADEGPGAGAEKLGQELTRGVIRRSPVPLGLGRAAEPALEEMGVLDRRRRQRE